MRRLINVTLFAHAQEQRWICAAAQLQMIMASVTMAHNAINYGNTVVNRNV